MKTQLFDHTLNRSMVSLDDYAKLTSNMKDNGNHYGEMNLSSELASTVVAQNQFIVAPMTLGGGRKGLRHRAEALFRIMKSKRTRPFLVENKSQPRKSMDRRRPLLSRFAMVQSRSLPMKVIKHDHIKLEGDFKQERLLQGNEGNVSIFLNEFAFRVCLKLTFTQLKQT
jgi:hypothetical protein